MARFDCGFQTLLCLADAIGIDNFEGRRSAANRCLLDLIQCRKAEGAALAAAARRLKRSKPKRKKAR